MPTEILVVDDEQDIRDLVGGILEDEGFSVRTAGNSNDAINAVRTRAPKLVGILTARCTGVASTVTRSSW